MSYPIDMNDLQYELARWTEKTFPERTLDSILNHLGSEINELRDSPDDIMEFADCFMLLLDAASYQNISMANIWKAMGEKLDINKKRKWGEPTSDVFTNNQAFPKGMTLRDYFAAHAVTGFVANPQGLDSFTELAKASYEVADAMLAARSQGREE